MDLHLLIVDDDPSIAKFMKMKLSMEAPDFSIACVEDARECISHLKDNKTDCILSDYQMPGMNGLELLKELRASGDDTPFIFFTGQGNEEVAREAFKNGADDYFTKDMGGFAQFDRIINSIVQAARRKSIEAEHKRAEAAFFEEKNKLDSVLASIGDAISIQDTDFKVLYQNPAHRKVAGELRGEYCYRIYKGREAVCDGCPVEMSYRDGGIHTVERCVQSEQGRACFEITASPLRDTAGRIIAGIKYIRDITGQKQVSDALQASRKYLETIIDTAPECIKLLSKDGILLMMNRSGLEMIQAGSLEQVKGKSVYGLVVPEYREAFKSLGEKVFRGGSGTLEFEMVGFKGRRLRLYTHAVPLRDERDEIIAILGLTRDITEQKRVEEELRESEERFRTLFESANDGLFLQDDGGVFVDCNKKAVEMYGCQQKNDVVGLSPVELAPEVQPDGENSEEKAHRFISAVLAGSPQVFYWKARCRDGRLLDVEVLMNALKLKGKTYIQATIRDISERRELERQKDDFYAMISHDLKTPLMTIMGLADMLARENTERFDKCTLDAFTLIRKSSFRLSNLVDDFLAVSKIESGCFKLNPFVEDITDALREAKDEFASLARNKGIDFTYEAGDGMPKAIIDKKLVERAVSNLLHNAVNYTPSGGRITLKVEYAVKENGNQFILSVSDTGPGIPPEEQTRVFEKYYRSPGTAGVKGSGLGLTIVKAVAEAHGGRVELDSEGGKGSTFRLILPAGPPA